MWHQACGYLQALETNLIGPSFCSFQGLHPAPHSSLLTPWVSLRAALQPPAVIWRFNIMHVLLSSNSAAIAWTRLISCQQDELSTLLVLHDKRFSGLFPWSLSAVTSQPRISSSSSQVKSHYLCVPLPMVCQKYALCRGDCPPMLTK